jgi:hypothetical protein
MYLDRGSRELIVGRDKIGRAVEDRDAIERGHLLERANGRIEAAGRAFDARETHQRCRASRPVRRLCEPAVHLGCRL